MPPEAHTPTRKTVARVTALLVALALTSLIGRNRRRYGGYIVADRVPPGAARRIDVRDDLASRHASPRWTRADRVCSRPDARPADRGSVRAGAGTPEARGGRRLPTVTPREPWLARRRAAPGGHRGPIEGALDPTDGRNELHGGDDLGHRRARPAGQHGSRRPYPGHRHGERPVPELQQDDRTGRRSTERRPERLLQLGAERQHERPAHPLRPPVGPVVHHDDRHQRRQ